jgi:hypothetical protein
MNDNTWANKRYGKGIRQKHTLKTQNKWGNPWNIINKNITEKRRKEHGN